MSVLLILLVYFVYKEKTANPLDKYRRKIKQVPVFMVSKTFCPFCKKAKEVLDKYNIPEERMEVLEVDGRPDMDQIQDFFLEMTGERSAPRGFIGGVCLGGGDQTVDVHERGELEGLLRQAGAID